MNFFYININNKKKSQSFERDNQKKLFKVFYYFVVSTVTVDVTVAGVNEVSTFAESTQSVESLQQVSSFLEEPQETNANDVAIDNAKTNFFIFLLYLLFV